MIPEEITFALEETFNITIQNERSVSGGSINRAHRLETNRGTLFLKWNSSTPDNFFEIEARGLELLSSIESGLRIPSVFACQPQSSSTPGFLLMEYISEGSGGSANAFEFGIGLATLHQSRAEFFGLPYDNYIGSLPQKNGKFDNWTSFFIEKRINPQLKMAIDEGKLKQNILANWKRLMSRLDDIFPPCKPSLLHGDLWGGNYLFDENGNGVLIDPAVYYGHPEMDLAFTKMFGGFSKHFYEGYESVHSLEKGFSNRISIYNMYPLLVHVNLFGGHYALQFDRLIKRF